MGKIIKKSLRISLTNNFFERIIKKSKTKEEGYELKGTRK